ncbi:MAG: hypothetical protein CM15mP23_03040 [Cryomorphaceae bacterium]|nr:MAG: hypothetical protein CM15mP23_03040 [Cryomorphaceae bacterium]
MFTNIVEGCTNPEYLEYDFEANTDDGSCLTIAISGCMDSNYLEFDENANIFNSSMCITELISGVQMQIILNIIPKLIH